MAEKVFTRKHKAIALVPLALVSGAWTASLASFDTTANASASQHGKGLPDGTTVPSEAIEAPANLPTAGVLAPGVPAGTADQVVDSASTSGIPSAALAAYQRAAQVIDSADTTCNVPWELIAAIGRVESDHGRYGGNVLSDQGVSEPGIYGIPLDGKNGTQQVQDTDGGALDDDTVYDRAVGPMQFIPSTWQIVKVDANGDGQRNPQDINDASLATAVYLCSGDEDLGSRDGQEASVFRYNHSEQYVDLVLRLMDAYMAGDYTAVPTGASGGSLYSLADYTGINEVRGKAKHKKAKAAAAAAAAAAQQQSGTSTPSTTNPTTGKPTTTTVTPTKAPSKLPVEVPTKVPTEVVSPAAQAIGHAAALAVCNQQIAAIPSVIGLSVPGGAAESCANKVQDMTSTAAAAAEIPNTLQGLLAWL